MVQQGHPYSEVAECFDVQPATICRRINCSDFSPYEIPTDLKQLIRTLVKEGYTKQEAADMTGENLGTVYRATKDLQIKNNDEGNHIIRREGIILINRLLEEGCIVGDYCVEVVRKLRERIPSIKHVRFKNRNIFFLPGREQETAEKFFKSLRSKIISYHDIDELCRLLDTSLPRDTKRAIHSQRFHKKYEYWNDRKLLQKSIYEYLK